MGERAFMRRLQHDTGRGIGLEGLLPARRAKAPAIARLGSPESRRPAAASTDHCRAIWRKPETPRSPQCRPCGCRGPRPRYRSSHCRKNPVSGSLEQLASGCPERFATAPFSAKRNCSAVPFAVSGGRRQQSPAESGTHRSCSARLARASTDGSADPRYRQIEAQRTGYGQGAASAPDRRFGKRGGQRSSVSVYFPRCCPWWDRSVSRTLFFSLTGRRPRRQHKQAQASGANLVHGRLSHRAPGASYPRGSRSKFSRRVNSEFRSWISSDFAWSSSFCCDNSSD